MFVQRRAHNVSFERLDRRPFIPHRRAFFSVGPSKKKRKGERKRRGEELRDSVACVRRRQLSRIGPMLRARCIDFVPWQTGCRSRLPALSRCAFLRIRLTDRAWYALWLSFVTQTVLFTTLVIEIWKQRRPTFEYFARGALRIHKS